MSLIRRRWLVPILGFWLALSALGADLYVDGEVGDDQQSGASWSQAKQTVHAALTLSQAGDVVHVAEGVYTERLQLISGVALLGGYPSGGGARDPVAHRTILDGESQGRVLEAAEDALLDGFTVTGGRATRGAAMRHPATTMEVRDCIFEHNVATGGNPDGGGAVYARACTSRFLRCIFRDNRLEPESVQSAELVGGAVLTWAASPIFEDCLFQRNLVDYSGEEYLAMGGAIWSISSRVQFLGCRFEQNQAVLAGAVGWWNRSIPQFDRCTFQANAAIHGGAVYGVFNENHYPTMPTRFRHCRFLENTAEIEGGALVLGRHGWIEMENCLVAGNTAGELGGGLSLSGDTDVQLCRVTVADNRLTGSGSLRGCGLAASGMARLVLDGCILARNRGGGAGLHVLETPLFGMVASNLWDNDGGDWSAGGPEPTGAMRNQATDPLFVASAGCDYYLSEPQTQDPAQQALGLSPCVDSGWRSAAESFVDVRSTRTDRQNDFGRSDTGYHPPALAPFLADHDPAPGADRVSPDAVVRVLVLDEQQDLRPETVTLTVEGVPITPEVTDCFRGLALEFPLEGSLPPGDPVEIEVQGLDAGGHSVINGLYSFTLVGGPTPTPLPMEPDLALWMNQEEYRGGDRLTLNLTSRSPGTEWFLDRYLVLEVLGEYFFAPAWDQELAGLHLWLPFEWEDTESPLDLVLPAPLAPGGPFAFYAAFLDPVTQELVGPLAQVSFRFVP